MMATLRSEVYQWLCSISNALELERLAGEFESRGFRTVDSLKYIKSPDLDVLFPSPHKLMMAEKQIIESEIEKVKSLKSGQLPPWQLFPALPRQVSYDQTSTFTSPSAASFVFLNDTSINKTFRLTAKTSEEVGVGEVTEPQVSTQPASYLKRREDYLKHENDLLAAQIQSAKDVLEMKTREFENYGSGSTERKKLCSASHLPDHNKNKCRNAPCKGIDFCHNRDKHQEFRAEIQDLKKVVKELEKKQEKAKSEFDVFKTARERAANSFFSVTQPRLRKQNYIKYVDRSAIDKDLLILKKALANKIPLNEDADWELPYIIERYKRANVDILSLV